MATILIVDDHAINRQFLMTLLSYGGHRLLEAAEGATALAMVRADRPDLVITDILMPNMDGYEFVTHMRAHPSLAKVPVIFYTASYRAREARSMAQACGVQWVLSKPSEPEVILATVQEALGLLSTSADEPDASSVLSAPHLTASLEADNFSVIGSQLGELINTLDNKYDLVAQVVPDAQLLETQRATLRRVALKMTESFGSLQQVSLRLTRLVEMGLDLAAERDPGRLLEILCRAAQSICVARYAAVAVLTDSGKSLGYCFTRGMEGDMATLLRALPPHSGVLGRLLSLNTPTRMNGLEGAPDILGLPPTHPPVHSFLGLPLSSKETVYGWLYLVDKSDGGEFTDVDEQVAATIASQMAAAYENLLLYDEIDQHRAQLQMEVVERKQAQEALRKNLLARTVMAECNRVLVHADDEMTLQKEMCLTIADSGGYAQASIWYADAADDAAPQLRLVAQAGMTDIQDSLFGTPWVESEHGRFPAAQVLSSGRSFMLDDSAGPDSEAWRETAAAQGYRSVLSLPLRESGKIYGALTIYALEPNGFRKDQIEMFEQLASDIAYGTMSLRHRHARVQAEQGLRAAQQKLTDILGSIDNIVWSMSESRFTYISPVAEKIFGYPLADFYRNRNRWSDSIHPDDKAKIDTVMTTLQQQGSVNHEYRIIDANGQLRWLEERCTCIMDMHGSLLRIDGVASDITERKSYQARIEYLATHDPLTGLANRNLLQDRLSQAIAHAQRSREVLALLFLDLDHFKDVNDRHGHAAGDALLSAIATRLRSVVREGDTVARPGGDEFIVLLTGIADLANATAITAKLIQVFATPFDINGITLSVSASIGMSLYPDDGKNIDALLANTDTAMYRAKESGGNGLRLFAQERKPSVTQE